MNEKELRKCLKTKGFDEKEIEELMEIKGNNKVPKYWNVLTEANIRQYRELLERLRRA